MKIWIRPHATIALPGTRRARAVRSWEIVRDGTVIEIAKSRKHARARMRDLLALYSEEIKATVTKDLQHGMAPGTRS
jgi:hypothetical protein